MHLIGVFNCPIKVIQPENSFQAESFFVKQK